ncbi:MAG: hypothetical protein GXX85_12770 [Ignavibacteria bacterium]|nr:hypothetical protein [Ignavibacteria bacterium]
MIRNNIILFLFALHIITCEAQPLKNLDIFFNFTDELFNEISSEIPDTLKTEFTGDNSYNILRNQFIFKSYASGKTESSASDNTLSVNIKNASVKYEYSGGANIISSYDIKRSVFFEGTYIIYKDGTASFSSEFNKAFSDTLEFEMIEDVETQGIDFTKGEKPGGNFFSSIAEPLIAVAAIAVTIYLLFTVRSN